MPRFFLPGMYRLMTQAKIQQGFSAMFFGIWHDFGPLQFEIGKSDLIIIQYLYIIKLNCRRNRETVHRISFAKIHIYTNLD